SAGLDSNAANIFCTKWVELNLSDKDLITYSAEVICNKLKTSHADEGAVINDDLTVTCGEMIYVPLTCFTEVKVNAAIQNYPIGPNIVYIIACDDELDNKNISICNL